MHRALSEDPKIRLGSLVAPFGERTQSEGETLDLLLAFHLPNSVQPAGACRTKPLDLQVAAKIVTYRKVGWAIDSFVPFKRLQDEGGDWAWVYGQSVGRRLSFPLAGTQQFSRPRYVLSWPVYMKFRLRIDQRNM